MAPISILTQTSKPPEEVGCKETFSTKLDFTSCKFLQTRTL